MTRDVSEKQVKFRSSRDDDDFYSSFSESEHETDKTKTTEDEKKEKEVNQEPQETRADANKVKYQTEFLPGLEDHFVNFE